VIAAADVPFARLPVQLTDGSDLALILTARNLRKVLLCSLLAEPLHPAIERSRFQQWLWLSRWFRWTFSTYAPEVLEVVGD
jgi:hypothetical protein